jgi:PAS domain S-box-containing protein
MIIRTYFAGGVNYMGELFKCQYIEPDLIVVGRSIIKISNNLESLMGFTKGEILSKNIIEFWSAIKCSNINEILVQQRKPYAFYAFTRKLDLREISVTYEEDSLTGIRQFYISEIPNSRLEDKCLYLSQISKDDLLGIAVLNPEDLTILKANKQFLKVFGEEYCIEENSIGRKLKDIYSKSSFDIIEKARKQILMTGESIRVEEFEYVDSHGNISYMDGVIRPIKIDMKLKYITVTIVDITEKVRYRNELEKKSEVVDQKKKQLEAIIEALGDIIYIFDKEGGSIYKDKILSQSCCTSCTMVSDSKFLYMDGNKVLVEDTPYMRVMRGKKFIGEKYIISNDENVRHCEITGIPIFDEKGEFMHGVIVTHEITKLVNYDGIIRSQHDDLYKIINEIECPIARLSYPDLKVIQINNNIVEFLKRYTKSLGLDLEVLSKINLHDFAIHNNIEKSMKCIQQAVESKSSVYLRNEKVFINDTERCFNTIYQPIFGMNNEIVEMLIMLIDITKEAQEKREVENVLEMQGEFFSFIAHEFRTPLTTMSATLQLLDLVYTKEMTPNIRKYINTIRRSTFQQLRLVNNLLDITRAEAGYLKVCRKKHEIVSVTNAILESIKPFALDKNIKLRFKSSFKEKLVALDDEKYERILLNLLSNAIKFTPSGKFISVTLSSNNDKVFICIKDNGIGIPKDKQAHIFERFGQSDSRRSRGGEGTGIGLYLVKLLVESMNGEISLSSKENKGSTFIITLPEVSLVSEENEELPELFNNRLVQGLQLEFSNIYSD